MGIGKWLPLSGTRQQNPDTAVQVQKHLDYKLSYKCTTLKTVTGYEIFTE